MPQDSRRINGPPETQSLVLFMKRPDAGELISETGVRRDGRKFDEIRPMYIKSGRVLPSLILTVSHAVAEVSPRTLKKV